MTDEPDVSDTDLDPRPDESREANPTGPGDADAAADQVERLGRHSEPQSGTDPAPSEAPGAPSPEDGTDQ